LLVTDNLLLPKNMGFLFQRRASAGMTNVKTPHHERNAARPDVGSLFDSGIHNWLPAGGEASFRR
jgi:hypothetical protein